MPRSALAAPLVAAVGLSLLGGAPVGAAAPASYGPALSHPREDSYYPDHGDPGVDALHYGLRLRWDRRHRTLRGAAVVRLRATADAPSFRLDLADRMTVSRATVGGHPVTVQQAHDVLTVQRSVVEGRRYTVRIAYRGTPAPVAAPTDRSDYSTIGMSVTRDGQLRTMQEPFGAFTWYPVNDTPSDKAFYDVRVTAPRGWVGVSNGRLTGTRRTATQTTTRFHLAHPTSSYLTTLAVGPYVHRTAIGPHGLPLSYWLPRGSADHYLRALGHLPADLRWLESRLGRYPFESAGVVVVPGRSAMETQTLVTFGRRDWGSVTQARQTLVHELAHQWYGDTVTPADWRDLWMNEGMAMYVEARWSSSHTPLTWAQWVDYFREANIDEREEQGGPGAYDPDKFATGCVYLCTSMMYEQLRHKIGDHDFWRVVRTWPHRRPDTNVDRAGFERYVERVSGRELTRFFRGWLNASHWSSADDVPWPPSAT